MSETELKYIEEHRRLVFEYHHDKEEFFDREDEFKAQKKLVMEKLQQLSEKYQLRRQKYQNVLNSVGKELSERFSEKNHIDEELQKADRFAHDEKLCPPILAEGHENLTPHNTPFLPEGNPHTDIHCMPRYFYPAILFLFSVTEEAVPADSPAHPDLRQAASALQYRTVLTPA
jgi:hypothetical protein